MNAHTFSLAHLYSFTRDKNVIKSFAFGLMLHLYTCDDLVKVC
jgi:hypothetical protein